MTFVAQTTADEGFDAGDVRGGTVRELGLIGRLEGILRFAVQGVAIHDGWVVARAEVVDGGG